MKKFPITYYDGKSSIAHKAELFVHEHYWNLIILNEGKEIRWNVNGIISSETQTKQFVSFNYGVYPFQYIECFDKELKEEIKIKK